MAKEKMDEIIKTYPIPYNFIDESKMFGGMVKTRNFVEGCICAFIASLPVFAIPFISFNARVILFIIFVVPALVFGIIGINGDPISKFIVYYIKFRKSRRIVSFNNKVKLHERIDVDALSETELPRDKIIKLLNNLGARREKAKEEEITDAEDFIFDDDLEEIRKKEEEAKKMLKASTKYVQNIAPQTEFANTVDSFEENIIDNDINDSENDIQNDEMEDIEYNNIPVLEEILSSQTDDMNDLLDIVDNQNVSVEESIDAVVDEENELVIDNPEEIIMLADEFLEDYKETKIVEINQQENQNLSNDITAQNIEKPVLDVQKTDNKPPVKKNIVLPWTCECGTRNIGKFCSECGNPKP
mgnify:CR=1 FL=1